MRVKTIICSQDLWLPGGLEFKANEPFVLTEGQKLTWSVARDWPQMAEMRATGKIVEEMEKPDEKPEKPKAKKEG